MIKKISKSKNEGFALLIGVLMAGILITISYSLFAITLNQATLAIAGKDSQMAFYAADTGLECALYSDYKIEKSFIKVSVDNSGVVSLDVPEAQTNPPRKCNGDLVAVAVQPKEASIKDVNREIKTPASGVYVSSFTVKSAKDKSCAAVKVYKYVEKVGDSDILKTKIESRGYNTCNANDPQRLERGLEVYY